MKRINVFKILLLSSLSIFISLSFKILQNDPWPVPSKYKNMENPYSGSEDTDQIGKELYMVHCRSCHGNKGKGDGSKASTLETEVTDITTENFKAQTDGELYYKSYIGRGDMPSFEKKINNEEDRWMLINYIRDL